MQFADILQTDWFRGSLRDIPWLVHQLQRFPGEGKDEPFHRSKMHKEVSFPKALFGILILLIIHKHARILDLRTLAVYYVLATFALSTFDRDPQTTSHA